MRIVNVKPMSAAWHDWRREGLGSSDASTVMEASKWSTRVQLWGERTGRKLSRPGNQWMERGLELEPLARREYERMTGRSMPPVCAESDYLPFMRASFDGLSRGLALEIKCPGAEDHATAMAGKIPKHYLWQCVHLMAVAEVGSLDYFSFDGERGVIVPMEYDRDLEEKLIEEEIGFWRSVLQDTPPIKLYSEPAPTKESTFQERLQKIIQTRKKA